MWSSRHTAPETAARAAQTSANVAQGRLLLMWARSQRTRPEWLPSANGSCSADTLAGLRERVRAIGLYDVYLAAIGVGGSTNLFDFDAFAHGLTGLPEHDARVIEQAVWELEQF